MRGCLYTLVLALVALALLVGVALPAVAAGMLTGAVTAVGLQSADTTVTVGSDPPTDLLLLRADRVHITATNATFHGLEIRSLDVTLTGVSLLGRSAEGVDGRLDGVVATGLGVAQVDLGTIRLSGGGDTVTVATAVSAAEARILISDAVRSSLGVLPSSLSLTSPDGVQAVVAGVTVHARLSATSTGDLIATVLDGPSAGQVVTVLASGPDFPIRVTSATVTGADGVRLRGVLTFGLLG